jgi:hypothetical protein
MIFSLEPNVACTVTLLATIKIPCVGDGGRPACIGPVSEGANAQLLQCRLAGAPTSRRPASAHLSRTDCHALDDIACQAALSANYSS